MSLFSLFRRRKGSAEPEAAGSSARDVEPAEAAAEAEPAEAAETGTERTPEEQQGEASDGALPAEGESATGTAESPGIPRQQSADAAADSDAADGARK